MLQTCIFKGGVNEDVASCVETTGGDSKTNRKTPAGRQQRGGLVPREPSWVVAKGAGKARGYLPTYCGVGVGAEHSVLPDDAVQLERGQPGHEDHGGGGGGRLDARRRTWNWTQEPRG